MPKASPPQHCCATNSAPTHDWRCRNCRKRDKWSNYKRSKKWCVKNCTICSAALESRASRRAATATSQAAAASAASLASQGLGRQPRKGRKRAASTQSTATPTGSTATGRRWWPHGRFTSCHKAQSIYDYVELHKNDAPVEAEIKSDEIEAVDEEEEHECI